MPIRITPNHITASGNISASGTIYAAGLDINGSADIESNLLGITSLTAEGISATSNLTSPFIRLGANPGHFAVLNNAQTDYLNFGTRDANGSEAVLNLNHIGDITATGSLFIGSASNGGNITTLGVISSSKVDSEFSLYAHSASFTYISASTGEFDANTITIGGTPLRKTDLDNLKAGKSIATDNDKKFVNSVDDTTYIRMGTSKKAWHYINDQPILKLGIGNVVIGDSSTSTTFGSAGITGGMVVTGSTVISGSTTVSGSFTVTDLLTVLANYGQTGSFSVSGSSTLDGDVNLDGQVTVTDLLTVLSGFGASGDCEVSGGLEISGSGLVIDGGNKALVVTGSTELSGSCVVSGSFTVTDLLTVLANYGQTGSFSVSGSSTLDGDVNLDGQVTGSTELSGSCVVSGSVSVTGGFNTGNLLDLLANWGSVGLPTGSAATGSGGVSVGDINLDGQVNVSDLLLLLVGMGNPQCIDTDLVIPQNTNYQMIGPEIGVCEGITVTVGTNSFFSIT